MSSVIHFHRSPRATRRSTSDRSTPASARKISTASAHRVDPRDTQQVAFRVSCCCKAVSFVAGQVLDSLDSPTEFKTVKNSPETGLAIPASQSAGPPLTRTGLPSHTI